MSEFLSYGVWRERKLKIVRFITSFSRSFSLKILPLSFLPCVYSRLRVEEPPRASQSRHNEPGTVPSFAPVMCSRPTICRTSLRGSYSILRSRRSPARTVELSWLCAVTKGSRAVSADTYGRAFWPRAPVRSASRQAIYRGSPRRVPLSLLGSGQFSCFFLFFYSFSSCFGIAVGLVGDLLASPNGVLRCRGRSLGDSRVILFVMFTVLRKLRLVFVVRVQFVGYFRMTKHLHRK